MPTDSGLKNTKFDTTFMALCASSEEMISMRNQNSEVAESVLNLSLVLFKVLTYFLTPRYQHFRATRPNFLSLPLSLVKYATIEGKVLLIISESLAKWFPFFRFDGVSTDKNCISNSV